MLFFADTLTTITSYLIAGLAAAELAGGWWRSRDRHRAELLINAGLALVILLGQSQLHTAAASPLASAAATLFVLSLPILQLRLISHFHPVARVLWPAAIAIALVGSVVSFAVPAEYRDAWQLVLCGYLGASFSVIGARFNTAASSAFGAGAMRLQSAAAASWMQVAIVAAFALAIIAPATAPIAAIARKALSVGMFICAYIAFVGPRLLTSLWTHRELYRYLQAVTERAPDDRARETPGDLARAAKHSVACAATCVLVFDDEEPNTLVSFVGTSGASPLRGLSVPFGDGLATEAIRRGSVLTGAPADCEPGLSDAIRPLGAAVTIVPIASSDRAWGALIIIQRVGALFSYDDQETLTELCRHAATSFSHTRLVTMELDRLRRDATSLRQVREAPKRVESRTPVSPFADTEGRLQVLAVEDEDGVRDFLRALLSREGYRVTIATGHDDALARAAETPFDLIVTDVNMPDGNGPALVKALRRRQPYLPAVYISGISRDEFSEMSPGEERNFLQKPFEGARLIGRIEALLQR